MPTFETPDPISVTLELGVANVRISASDRTDTVVEARPSDETDESDVRAAAQVRVEYADGALQVTGPRRGLAFSRESRSVEVTIDLPAGSRLSAHLLMGHLHGAGRLGQCRVRTTGDVRFERTGPLTLHTGFGQVDIENVAGAAEVSTGSGRIRIGEIEGTAVVKNSNGDTTIDAVTGDLRVRNANGAIDVERAGSDVDAKTSNGAIRLGEVVRGQVVLGTAAGHLDVGIAGSTAAWLEMDTGFGQLRNLLETVPRPDDADETVEVRGRTSYGDITIHRS